MVRESSLNRIRLAARQSLERAIVLASVAFFETRFPPADSLRFWWYWKKCQWARPWRRRGPGTAIMQAVRHFGGHRFCFYRDDHTVEMARQIKAFLAPWFAERRADSYMIGYDGEPWEIPGVKALFAGRVRELVEALMGSSFTIFYAVAYRSIAQSRPPEAGYSSTLWHADGTPPSCFALMLYLDDTDEGNGATELAPRKLSVRALMNSVSAWSSLSRELRVEKFREAVEAHGSWHVARAPAGSLLVFSNNLLHRGGLAQGTRSRDVLIFHLYPAMSPLEGEVRTVRKTAAVPGRPDF
jgi:hypothetical protein